MSELQISDEELVVPPLPGWLLPVAGGLTAIIGLAIWLLWTVSGPLSSLIDPTWIFLCH